MRGLMATIFALGILAVGCQSESPEAPPGQPAAQGGCKPAAGTPKAALNLAAAPKAKISFNQDVYPLLTGSGGTRDYKCLNCHPSWRDPAEISNDTQFFAIINSIKSGRMPLGPARVTAEDLKTIEAWRDGGYLVDRPVDKTIAANKPASADVEKASGTTGAAAPCP